MSYILSYPEVSSNICANIHPMRLDDEMHILWIYDQIKLVNPFHDTQNMPEKHMQKNKNFPDKTFV